MPKFIFTSLLLCFGFFLFGQDDENPKLAEFGFHLRPIFESETFRTGARNFEEGDLRLGIRQKSGFSYGVIIRYSLHKSINFEGGLSVTTRQILLDIEDAEFDYKLQSSFRLLAYELPVNVMIKVPVNDNINICAAGGVTLDFLPSDAETSGPDNNFDHRTFYKSWIQASLSANVGAEYQSKNSGSFFLGVSLHRPFSPLTLTRVETNQWNPSLGRNESNEIIGSILGSYLTLDFRYFFNDNK